MKQYPSIFNDVIGPVMVGHSSSHTAASVRIGNVIRQLAEAYASSDEKKSPVKKISFSFDVNSSLATTYHGQGSDIGLLAGLLGFETHDKRIKDAYKYADEEKINYSFEVKEIGEGHPNAYYVDFTDSKGNRLFLTALSTGGGMIEIVDFMGFLVSIDGGFFETLIICENSESATSIKKEINKTYSNKVAINISEKSGESSGEPVEKSTEESTGEYLINVKSDEDIKLDFPEAKIFKIKPVLPVMSQINLSVPFVTAAEIINYSEKNQKQFWELAVLYESERSRLSPEEVLKKMENIVARLKVSLEEPLCETPLLKEETKNRILPNQSFLIEKANTLGGSFNKNVIKYVTKFMDIKTSMGIFVAAPTAGSCGCVSGCIFALAEELKLSDEVMAKAFLSAGLIGVLIAHSSTFAAELCGCQAECGSGSGMCAAACAWLLGGSVKTCLAAASMALQSILGLVCDPVGNKVEVPCLGKNIMSAFNAIASANMAAAGFAEVIPLDETITAMDAVGRSINRELRCTGLGGLSVTKASQEILKTFGWDSPKS